MDIDTFSILYQMRAIDFLFSKKFMQNVTPQYRITSNISSKGLYGYASKNKYQWTCTIKFSKARLNSSFYKHSPVIN